MNNKTSLAAAAMKYIKHHHLIGSPTYKAKVSDFAHLLGFLARDGHLEDVPLSAITPANIQRFIDAQLAEGYEVTTINRRLATIKHFCGWVGRQWAEFAEPEIKYLPIQTPEPRGVTPAERERLLAAAHRHGQEDWERARNKFIIALLFSTGLRISELRLLKVSQLQGEFLRKVQGKGHKFRDVYLSDNTRELIADYLDWRQAALMHRWGQQSFSSSLPVLITVRNHCTYDDLLMDERTLSWTIRAIDTKASVPHFTAHVARHQRCKDIIERTGDLPLAADQLGHSDVKVTMRYARLKESDIRRKLG